MTVIGHRGEEVQGSKIFKKALTHPGQFHAHDVLVSAFIIREGMVNAGNIYRSNPTQEDLEDPEVLVYDQGGYLEPENNNYDHHVEAPKGVCLEFEYLYKGNNAVKEILKKRLFSPVMRIDEGVKDTTGISFNSMIRVQNSRENGFDHAVEIAKNVYEGYRITAWEAVDGERRWRQLKSPVKGIKIMEDTAVIPQWKELAFKQDVKFLITPNIRISGTHNLITRSTDEIVIPEDDKQVFRHPSGFMASYRSVNDALYIAQKLMKTKD